MPPDIAQALGHHLEYFGSQPVVELYLAFDVYFDLDPGRAGKLLCEPLYGRQELGLSCLGFLQTSHVSSQLRDAPFSEVEQAVDFLFDTRPRRSLTAEGVQAELKTDVRLDDAVVQIPCDSQAFRFGSIGGQPVYQSNVVK